MLLLVFQQICHQFLEELGPFGGDTPPNKEYLGFLGDDIVLHLVSNKFIDHFQFFDTQYPLHPLHILKVVRAPLSKLSDSDTARSQPLALLLFNLLFNASHFDCLHFIIKKEDFPPSREGIMLSAVKYADEEGLTNT